MSDDIKSKIDSLKSLKSQVSQWKKEDIRQRTGKKKEQPKEVPQEDILESILKKIGK